MRNVLLKAAGPQSSTFTGVAFGHYFVAGKPVSREEYFAQARTRQGKPGAAERAAVRGKPGGGRRPAKPQAKVASAGKPAPADARHNPLLDDVFARPTEAAKPQAGGGSAEPARHPSRHNPEITYGNADDRDSDDAHFGRSIKRARQQVEAAARRLARAEARGPKVTPEVRRLQRQLKQQQAREAKLRQQADQVRLPDPKAQRAARLDEARNRIAAGRDSGTDPSGLDGPRPVPIPLEAGPPPLPAARQNPSNAAPPPLPHQRTQQAALAAANALSQAVRGGDRTAARQAHERAIRALDAHLKEGLRAIDRMAASRYGGGPRAERAARQAKQAFKAKVQAVARRLTALRTGVGKSLSLPPLAFLPPAPDDVWNACTGVHDMQPDLVPWRVKQVADDLLAYLVPEADFKCDGGKLVVHGTATTDTMDPDRDIVLPVGGDLGRHQKNPIVLLNHRKDLPGIARTKSPDGAYTVRLVNDHRLDTSNYFDQHSKLSVQAFRLIESGALGGLSIGFVPKPGGVQKALGADRHPVFVYSQWELLEVTHAPIGVNPDAVVHAIEKGFGAGEALLPELKDLLIPYVPEPKPLVRSGWEPQPMSQPEPKEKAMGTTDGTAGGTPAGGDDPTTDLTPTTEVLHTVHAGVESLIAYITQAMKRVEAPATREALDEILTHAGKILDCCQETHAGHTADHPDQPPLPDPSDLDRDDDSDETMKAFARRAWWVHNKAMAEARRELENAEVRTVREVADELREDARDARFDLRTRKRFKAMAGRLAAVKGGHVPAVPDPDEVDWSPVAAEIEKRLA